MLVIFFVTMFYIVILVGGAISEKVAWAIGKRKLAKCLNTGTYRFGIGYPVIVILGTVIFFVQQLW